MSDDVVYIVQAIDGGPVKIGTTRHNRLKQRISELQTGNPSTLRCVRLFRGGKGLEARLHALFDSQRISPRSEWFMVNGALQSIIDDGIDFADDPIPGASAFRDIEWTCDRCEKSITKSNAGFIGINEHEVWTYKREYAKWESERTQVIGGFRSISGDALFSMPSPASWVALHDSCLADGESYSYWIAVDRVLSFPQVLDFTAHIDGRDVHTCSDWFAFLRRQIAHGWVTA